MALPLEFLPLARRFLGQQAQAEMTPPPPEVRPTAISDAELSAAMQPQPDPMAELRRRFLEARQAGQQDAAGNRLGVAADAATQTLLGTKGIRAAPTVQYRADAETAPVRALQAEVGAELDLARATTPKGAGAPSKPLKSTDPNSSESKRYQEAFRAQYPDAPAQLIGAITEENFDAFRKTLEAGAGIKARGEAVASQEEREKARLLQQKEEGQLNRAVQWARLRQDAEEAGKSRDFRRWLFEQEEDAKEKERGEKKQEKQDALTVPGAEVDPEARPTPKDAETVKGVLTSERRMKNGITRMRQLHKQYGTEKGGKGAMQLGQALTGLRLEAKNIAELGALSGPDQGLMESLAGDDPTDTWNNIKAFFGTDNTEAALQGLEAWMEGQVRATLEARGYRRKAAPAQAPQRKPASEVLPSDGKGGLTLEAQPPAASASGVTVLINGKPLPRPVPREKLEELKRRAKERGDTVEVQGG